VQSARAQVELIEAFAVRANRGVAVDSAGYMSPMARKYPAVRRLLKIEHIESLRRISDQVRGCVGLRSSRFGFLGLDTTLGQESSYPAQSGDRRATRDKLQEFPAALRLCDVHSERDYRIDFFQLQESTVHRTEDNGEAQTIARLSCLGPAC
jgi:hypothetical protein